MAPGPHGERLEHVAAHVVTMRTRRGEYICCGYNAYKERCVNLLWLQCVQGDVSIYAVVKMRTRNGESSCCGYNAYM